MTVYKRERLKNVNGDYIVTPSMADMVYHSDGETVEQKYTKINVQLSTTATQEYVQQKIAEASLSGNEVDLSMYATRNELQSQVDNIAQNSNQLKSYMENYINSSIAELRQYVDSIIDSQPSQPDIIPVTGIEVDEWNVFLQAGQTRQMIASVVPSNATNKNILWNTSAPEVARVSSNGLITAIKEGYAKIVATTEDGGIPYDIHVNVSAASNGGENNPSTPASISANPSSLSLQVGSVEYVTISFNGDVPNKNLDCMSSAGSIASVSHHSDYTYKVTANGVGNATINFRTADGNYSTSCAVIVTGSGSEGGSGSNPGGGSGSNSNISNASETALTQQYSSSHEATPNNPNPPAGAYNWVNGPRINPDGSFPQSSWNAIGHWMTTYKVSGSSYYDNVGLLLQDPKAWVWNTSTKSWDVLSDDFEWGTWYREDFWDDGSGNIAGTTEWEVGSSANHSKWVKIKQTSETNGRCFHPWGYQKNWRSNPDWANNGQPYIVTKIDFKLIKWNESGADNLDKAQLVVNSGADWWRNVGDVWQSDWSTNRDMAVGKYLLATKELKRAWCTNLPQNWSYGLPESDNSSSGGNTGGSGSGSNPGGGSDNGSTESSSISLTNQSIEQGSPLALSFPAVSGVSNSDGCCLFDSNDREVCTGYFETPSKAILDTTNLSEGVYTVYLSASEWREATWSNIPKDPRSNVFTLTVTRGSGGTGVSYDISLTDQSVNLGSILALTFPQVSGITMNDGCCLFDNDNNVVCTGYFESPSKAILETGSLSRGTYNVYLSASVWDNNSWSNLPKDPRSNVFALTIS